MHISADSQEQESFNKDVQRRNFKEKIKYTTSRSNLGRQERALRFTQSAFEEMYPSLENGLPLEAYEGASGWFATIVISCISAIFIAKLTHAVIQRHRTGKDDFEGRGTFRYVNGNVYEGEYKAGLEEGRGTYRWADGEVHDGEYKAGQMEGRGTYRFADGTVFDGEYKGDNMQGRGTYWYADGAVYDGEYKANNMEGRGTYWYANDVVEVGCYEAGCDVGEGARWSADRTKAWRLRDGQVMEEISLDVAKQIAAKLGELEAPPGSAATLREKLKARGEELRARGEAMSTKP